MTARAYTKADYVVKHAHSKPNPLGCCWVERTAAALISAAKSSQYTRDIFDDADHFISEGYSKDVALKLSCDYWL